MNNHVVHMHQKINSKTSQARLNCDKCFRSYIRLWDLNWRKRLEKEQLWHNFHATIVFLNPKKNLTFQDILLHAISNRNIVMESNGVWRHKIEEHNLIFEINKLDERCITSDISSRNYTADKALIEYKNDETLEIKNEIIQDPETSLDERCVTTDISSRNNSDDKTSIEYKNDETLEIKNEIIQDRETSSEKNTSENRHKKDDSILCSADIREDDTLAVDKPHCRTRQKIQESKQEAQKKYTCEKCARSYAQKNNLTAHKKYDCNVIPRFKCKFCSKRFKRKCHMCKHVKSVHLKTKLRKLKTRHNCDKCSRSYNWFKDLNRHKRSVHEAVKPKVVCDYCGHKTYRKNLLADHITARHFKEYSTRKIKHQEISTE